MKYISAIACVLCLAITADAAHRGTVAGRGFNRVGFGQSFHARQTFASPFFQGGYGASCYVAPPVVQTFAAPVYDAAPIVQQAAPVYAAPVVQAAPAYAAPVQVFAAPVVYQQAFAPVYAQAGCSTGASYGIGGVGYGVGFNRNFAFRNFGRRFR